MTPDERRAFEAGRDAISSERYRDFIIEYRPKPISTTTFDWEFYAEGYDGPGDRRCGTAASLDEAKAAIDGLVVGDESC